MLCFHQTKKTPVYARVQAFFGVVCKGPPGFVPRREQLRKKTAQKKSRRSQPDEESLEFSDAIDSGHLPNYNEDRGKQKLVSRKDVY